MSQTYSQQEGEIVRDFLSVADLLEETQLARIYTYIYREGKTTVAELIDALDLSQGTAYTYVKRLAGTGVLTPTTAVRSRRNRTYADRRR